MCWWTVLRGMSQPDRFLQEQGGVKQLFLTHRGAIGQVKAIQQETGCEVVIQEQEAYLLPQMAVTTFQQEIRLSPTVWQSGRLDIPLGLPAFITIATAEFCLPDGIYCPISRGTRCRSALPKPFTGIVSSKALGHCAIGSRRKPFSSSVRGRIRAFCEESDRSIGHTIG